MKNNVSLAYNLFLVVGDFLALIAAFVAAYILRVKFQVGLDPNDIGPSNGRAFLGAFFVMAPFWILIFSLLGLYNDSIHEKRFIEFGRLLVGSFIGLLFVVFWDFLSSESIFPARLVPIYGFAFGFVFLVVFRNLARWIRIWLLGYNIGLTRVVIVGNTAMSSEMLGWLSDRRSGYEVVGVVGGQKALGKHKAPLYPSFGKFLESHKGDLHGIIQTELYADETKNAKILTYAQEHHVSYRFVPGNTELFVGNIEVELFRSSIPVIAVHQTALFGWGRVVKRLFDIIVGSIMLIFALPVIGIISLIMVIFDHGDPIWRNTRLSRHGTKIKMFKFRTQLHAYHRMSPEEGFAKMGRPELAKRFRENGDFLEDDPRISRLGRFLRKTSLDELPQLFNVIKGDMSLVGPRPLEPFELTNYNKKNLMLSVKTGLTGLAAVSGRREISFEERRALDLYYVQNWSLWLDLVILVKTVRAVFGARGAR